jgi:hyperosmotically inducible periplasmic protein
MRQIAWLFLVSLLCFATACADEAGTETIAPPPDTSAPANTDADNTARNADNIQALPAQAENEADITISAAIRKAVVDDSALSLNAHNVKITTANGVVTLQGPVKSDREKQSIESKAKQVAGVKNVNNLLEVEKNP